MEAIPGKRPIERTMAPLLREVAKQYPIVTVTGPRQSGKTTLVRMVFPRHAYVSLEDPDMRRFALDDPRGFLGQFKGPVILDEAQRAPELFSYLQTAVDQDDRPGRFILSGSQNFLLLSSISQSLAGRCAVLHLLPLSLSELTGRSPLPPEAFGHELPEAGRALDLELMPTLFRGLYPRIHDKGLDPARWLRDYTQTYVERDVRTIAAVGDLESFDRFLRLCAGRNGEVLNLSSLGADAGISHSTVKRWISILEASFLVVLLRPYYKSFNKRLIKSPKLYFLDPGLLCYLLRIRTPEDLWLHASRGAVFESFVVSELLKAFYHRGEEPDLWFWRDSAQREIDVVLEVGGRPVPIELKSGQTLSGDAFKGLAYWRRILDDPQAPAALIHGGDTSYRRHDVTVYSWQTL